MKVVILLAVGTMSLLNQASAMTCTSYGRVETTKAHIVPGMKDVIEEITIDHYSVLDYGLPSFKEKFKGGESPDYNEPENGVTEEVHLLKSEMGEKLKFILKTEVRSFPAPCSQPTRVDICHETYELKSASFEYLGKKVFLNSCYSSEPIEL